MKHNLIRALAAMALGLALCALTAACTPAQTQPQDESHSDRQIESDRLALTDPEQLTPILHAGGALDGMTYLNAQESFLLYYEQGYRYFEYDLSLSTDGYLIGTHGGEHLGGIDPCALTYAEFGQLRLDGGYTPVDEQWLIDTLRQYPDVKIIVDAKMPTTAQDAEVLLRIEQLQELYGIDLSANIIPEVFSIEMWEILKESTSFDKYVFSHYKVNYSADTILEHFSDERICGIALPLDSSPELTEQLWRLQESGKEIWVFTCLDRQDLALAVSIGADHVYVDTPEILPGNSQKTQDTKGR